MVMLHSSPRSSQSLEPIMAVFASSFTCIGLDTPGYGLSDDFVSNPRELWEYTDALVTTLDTLSLGKVCLYGSATGGQICIQFSRKYPHRVELLVLDSVGDFWEEEKRRILNGYFQKITPVRDGSHLLRAWDMSRHLSVFFPWQSRRDTDRIVSDLPSPELIQHQVNDYLRAGPGYAKAYREAFNVENWEHAKDVSVPTILTRNSASPISPFTDSLISKGLPSNYKVIDCNGANRLEVQTAAAKEMCGLISDAPPPAIASNNHATLMQSSYVDTADGQLHARVNFSGVGRPIMAIHDPAGSSALVEPILSPYIGRRPVLALDNPGNGESDNILSPDEISPEGYATILCQALEKLGVREVDVIGRYSGGPVAMEMHFAQPTLVKHLALAGVGIFEGEEQRDLLENYTPSISPRWDGSHLLTAWGFMRDQSLYWPWYNRTKGGILRIDGAFDVALTDLRVRELLKVGDLYQRAYASMWTYPMRERLSRVTVPCLLCVPPWEPIYNKSVEAAKSAPNCLSVDLPANMADWHYVLDAFFASNKYILP